MTCTNHSWLTIIKTAHLNVCCYTFLLCNFLNFSIFTQKVISNTKMTRRMPFWTKSINYLRPIPLSEYVFCGVLIFAYFITCLKTPNMNSAKYFLWVQVLSIFLIPSCFQIVRRTEFRFFVTEKDPTSFTRL